MGLDMSISRRAFLRYSGGTALTLFLVGASGVKETLATIPGGTLDPSAIPKFTSALLVPPVMPKSSRLVARASRNIDYYEISMRQVVQQVLPSSLPATTVWAYGPVSAPRRGVAIHHAPSLTIEAKWQTPVRVRWVNELVDESGRFLPHLLPVDPTLHWANPAMEPDAQGLARTDTRPAYTGRTYVRPEDYTGDPATYTDYQGPVPIVTHVHGAMGVGDESDGYPEAWFLPDATNLPTEYAADGAWYRYHADSFERRFGQPWGPGFSLSQYPNHNRASTLCYHDHTLGMTRLNVYAGPAGFYILRGGPAGDTMVTDATTGQRAVLPGPAPREGDTGNKPYREIPLAIQDRSFNADGSLFYPDTRAFFDEMPPPYFPQSDVAPVWNPEFFGNTLMVNGKTWPFLDVEARRYRFRLLNGCQARFLILDFSGIPGVQAWQIANEGGFLDAPVDLTGTRNGRLLMAPAERADLIVDFTAVPLGNHVLGDVHGDPTDDWASAHARMWSDPVTANPTVGATRCGSSTTPLPTPTRSTCTRWLSKCSTGRPSISSNRPWNTTSTRHQRCASPRDQPRGRPSPRNQR